MEWPIENDQFIKIVLEWWPVDSTFQDEEL